MKKFCKSLREDAKRIIGFEKKKNVTVNKQRVKITQRRKSMLYSRKIFYKKLFRDISYWKVRDLCHYTGKYRGAEYSICSLKFKVPNEISVVFHNGSKYDYHFIIKELANEFEGPFERFWENSEIHESFSVPIRKEIIKIDKDGNKSVETIFYKIKFIDSFRFMSTSLSSLVGNLSEIYSKNIYNYI